MAVELSQEIKKVYGNAVFEGIGAKGRRQSFEISVKVGDEDEPVVVWSGIKKGPPRALKFPPAADVIASITKTLGK
jgi:hypothetical protein